MVLVILAMIWAAVLLPPYLQSRTESRPGNSISNFQRQLSVLERRSGTSHTPVSGMRPLPSSGPVRAPAVRPDVKRRRRDVLTTLAGAAGSTLLMALAMGGTLWMLHLLCDVLLGGYVFLLIQLNNRNMERQVKVRYLPGRAAAMEPAFLLRNSGT